jgi:hypothetical protein
MISPGVVDGTMETGIGAWAGYRLGGVVLSGGMWNWLYCPEGGQCRRSMGYRLGCIVWNVGAGVVWIKLVGSTWTMGDIVSGEWC